MFVSGSPAVFMDGFGVGPSGFGAIFAILAGGMILGGQLNHLLLKHFASEQVFRRALFVQVISGVTFLALSLTLDLGKWPTVVLLFAFLHCAGITYLNAAALALQPFTKNIGSASSLLGFLQLGMGAIAAALVGVLDLTGPTPMAFVMAVCSTAGWILLNSARRLGRRAPSNRPRLSEQTRRSDGIRRGSRVTPRSRKERVSPALVCPNN